LAQSDEEGEVLQNLRRFKNFCTEIRMKG